MTPEKMETSTTPRFPQWSVETLRFSTIYTDQTPSVARKGELWMGLRGEMPARLNQSNPNLILMGGPLKPGVDLDLRVLPNQVDLLLTGAEPQPSSAGLLGDLLPLFVAQVVTKALQSLLPCSRMALSLKGQMRFEDEASSLVALRHFASLADITNTNEFSLHTNRARESRAIPGLRINRAIRLQWGKFESSAIQMTDEGLRPVPIDSFHGIMLYVDVNNVAGGERSIGEPEGTRFLHEIIGLFNELTTNGDTL